MARIIRIIAVAFSCCSCAAMIYFSSKGNNSAVYTSLVLCLVGFLANMLATTHENKLKLEAEAAAEKAKAESDEDQMTFEV